MAFDNSNRGALFGNTRKTAPNHPDFTGNITLSQDTATHIMKALAAGQEPKLDLSGWSKTSGAGKKFMSLSVAVPWDAQKAQQPQQRQAPTPSAFDDDTPF